MPPGAGGAPLRVARRAVHERRLVREQVRVGAHDRERRPQLVGHEGDQLGPGAIERDELLDLRLGLGLEPALLDDAGEQVRDRGQLGDVGVAELAVRLGLDVEHADDLVAPRERHGQHRVHEAALVDAAHPQEAVVLADVGRRDRLAHRGHPPGDPLAEGHDRPADLVAVEAVRGGEPEVQPVAVEEVERGDVRTERVAGAVDDGLEELLPRPRGRREPQELVEEAELARGVTLVRERDLVRPTAAGGRGTGPVVERRHGEHDTSLGVAATFRRLRRGTGTVPLESNRNRRLLAGARPLPHPYAVAQPPARPRRASKPTRAARFPAVAAEPPGPGFGRARDELAREVRLLGALLGQVIAEQAGPELFELVERIRQAHDRPPPRRPGADARAGRGARTPRRGDRVAGPRPRGRGREGVHALLPARQPRRGAPADPRPPDPGPQGPRRADRRLGRRRHRAPRAGPRPRRPSRRSSPGSSSTRC